MEPMAPCRLYDDPGHRGRERWPRCELPRREGKPHEAGPRRVTVLPSKGALGSLGAPCLAVASLPSAGSPGDRGVPKGREGSRVRVSTEG